MLVSRYQLEAARFASTTMHTLRLGPEPRTVWATNGHYLVKVERPDEATEGDFPEIPGVTWREPPGELLLPVETAKAAARALKAQSRATRNLPILGYARVGLDASIAEDAPDQQIVVALTDLERPTILRACMPEGTFPDVADVLDRWKPGQLAAPIALSGHYLADIGQYAVALGRGTVTAIAWEFAAPMHPARFSWVAAGHSVVGLLMPMQV